MSLLVFSSSGGETYFHDFTHLSFPPQVQHMLSSKCCQLSLTKGKACLPLYTTLFRITPVLPASIIPVFHALSPRSSSIMSVVYVLTNLAQAHAFLELYQLLELYHVVCVNLAEAHSYNSRSFLHLSLSLSLARTQLVHDRSR